MHIEPPTAKPKDPLPEGEKRPKVLISGAGLGGVMLGIVLQKMGIPFEIFERSEVVRPLGSALSLSSGILPVFEQLGLLDELMKMSKVMNGIDLLDADMKEVAPFMTTQGQFEFSGYHPIVFARPDLHKLLLAQIPVERFHMKKKVVSLEQNQHGVMIRCQDHSTFHGDILVGADGAYSGVRQWLYKKLDDEKMLPSFDKKKFTVGFVTMVGVTLPMDPEVYPELADEKAHFRSIVGGKNLTWYVVTTTGNRFCWGVNMQLKSKDEAEQLMFQQSQWTAEALGPMIEKFRDFPSGYGCKLGVLFDATPKEAISKVFLEEKIFKTWYHGRTVLIGDACCKLSPSAGQGAVKAMQDAVVLANCINDIFEVTPENINAAFFDYRKQRFPEAKGMFTSSEFLAKLTLGQKTSSKVMRKIVFDYLPAKFLTMSFVKLAEYRPQITSLPPTENRGTVTPRPQKPSLRYTKELAAARAAAAQCPCGVDTKGKEDKVERAETVPI